MMQNNMHFLRNFVRQKSTYYNRHKANKDILIDIQGDLLYGIHPIKLAIQAKRRTIHQIFYNKYSEKAVEVAQSAEAQNAAVKTRQISRANLDELTRLAFKYKDHHVHQGLTNNRSKNMGRAICLIFIRSGNDQTTIDSRDKIKLLTHVHLFLCTTFFKSNF